MSRWGDNLYDHTRLPHGESDRRLSGHLTDEQFTDLLLGESSHSISEHLKVCAECREEAERVSGAIGSFERQSRLWAECETASRPRIQARRPAYVWLRPAPAWAVAAAAIALVFGLFFHTATGRIDRSSQPHPEIATTVPQPVAVDSTLQADNALLAAIDGELRIEDAPAATAYGLDLGARAVPSKPARKVLN